MVMYQALLRVRAPVGYVAPEVGTALCRCCVSASTETNFGSPCNPVTVTTKSRPSDDRTNTTEMHGLLSSIYSTLLFFSSQINSITYFNNDPPPTHI